ncbi:MAG: hypothetical protein HOD32_04660 [Nitrospina sp.]|nr:hypothetical protein [Nitrospina sp.]
MPLNKFFPAINLVFVLTIALLITLSVRTWTHPPYPSRVDGSSLVGSPKNLQKLAVNKPGYNAGTVSQVVQSNVFRKERKQYIPPPPPPSARPATAPKPALPPPNLVLKGVLMLAGTKIAILQGKYSAQEGGKVVQKKVKKKGYSLGQIVGNFELTEIEKNSVILDDKKGRKIRLRLAPRQPDKIIHREGTSLFQKNKKYDPRKFKATPVKNKPVRPKVAQPKPATQRAPAAPAPAFRVSGAPTPPPRVHISGK